MLAAIGIAEPIGTRKQKQGDSGRRQIESARKYAGERGYILDEVDRGKSAWTGRNISEGVLDEFIKRIESKTIPRGSILIVESPDRVSRQRFSEAYPTYQRILSAGIEIHSQYSGRFEAGTLLHQYSPCRRRNLPGELRKRADERKGRGSLVKEAGNVQTAKRP